MPVFHEDTYLFIDGEYLRRVYNEAMQSVFGCDGELSFAALKQNARATRVFFYDCIDDVQRPAESGSVFDARVAAQEVFFDNIRALEGVHVRLGSLRGKPKRLRQKEVDVLLATDMLTHGYDGNMRKAILIAGDLDFRPIVEALVRRGVFIEIWYERKSGARELPGAADFGRELGFETFYLLSSQSFQSQNVLPVMNRAHAPVDTPVVISQCVDDGRQVTLFHEANRSMFVIRAERSDGVLWFDHGDANVLQRYFSVKFGPVNWT
jgi:uncharacterized LabA/DUF88 family protein